MNTLLNDQSYSNNQAMNFIAAQLENKPIGKKEGGNVELFDNEEIIVWNQSGPDEYTSSIRMGNYGRDLSGNIVKDSNATSYPALLLYNTNEQFPVLDIGVLPSSSGGQEGVISFKKFERGSEFEYASIKLNDVGNFIQKSKGTEYEMFPQNSSDVSMRKVENFSHEVTNNIFRDFFYFLASLLPEKYRNNEDKKIDTESTEKIYEYDDKTLTMKRLCDNQKVFLNGNSITDEKELTSEQNSENNLLIDLKTKSSKKILNTPVKIKLSKYTLDNKNLKSTEVVKTKDGLIQTTKFDLSNNVKTKTYSTVSNPEEIIYVKKTGQDGVIQETKKVAESYFFNIVNEPTNEKIYIQNLPKTIYTGGTEYTYYVGSSSIKRRNGQEYYCELENNTLSTIMIQVKNDGSLKMNDIKITLLSLRKYYISIRIMITKISPLEYKMDYFESSSEIKQQ